MTTPSNAWETRLPLPEARALADLYGPMVKHDGNGLVTLDAAAMDVLRLRQRDHYDDWIIEDADGPELVFSEERYRLHEVPAPPPPQLCVIPDYLVP